MYSGVVLFAYSAVFSSRLASSSCETLATNTGKTYLKKGGGI